MTIPMYRRKQIARRLMLSFGLVVLTALLWPLAVVVAIVWFLVARQRRGRRQARLSPYALWLEGQRP